MSKLAQLLKSHIPPANPANPANHVGPQRRISSSSSISSGVTKDENSFANPANAEDDNEADLSPAQQLARCEVLKQIEHHPTVERAFVNRFDRDGTMIVTLAIRAIGTGELKIPAKRFSEDSLDDYSALLDIVGKVL